VGSEGELSSRFHQILFNSFQRLPSIGTLFNIELDGPFRALLSAPAAPLAFVIVYDRQAILYAQCFKDASFYTGFTPDAGIGHPEAHTRDTAYESSQIFFGILKHPGKATTVATETFFIDGSDGYER